MRRTKLAIELKQFRRFQIVRAQIEKGAYRYFAFLNGQPVQAKQTALHCGSKLPRTTPTQEHWRVLWECAQ